MRKCELAGMRSKNKPPQQNTMRKRKDEGREGEEHRRWTKKKKRTLFEKKNIVGRPFLSFLLDSQLFF